MERIKNYMEVERKSTKNVMDALSSVKHWDDDSIETFILYYFVNIQIFKGYLEEDADKEWKIIATQLSRTKESCQALLNMLQNTYLEIARTQIQNDAKVLDAKVLDITDVNWPYFDIFVKICQYDGTKQARQARKTEKTLQDLDLRLLRYYLKHKRLFQKAQFGGKIRLWSLIASQMEMSAEECANRLNSIKYKYLSQSCNPPKEKCNSIENIHDSSLYLLCSQIFTQHACENVDREQNIKVDQIEKVKNKTYTARKIRWQHRDLESLLKYYSDNFWSFEDEFFPKELWTPIAKDLDRTETECYQKVCELLKKHKKHAVLKQQKPNSRICWRYYDMIEDVYKSKQFQSEHLHVTNMDSQQVIDFKKEGYGTPQYSNNICPNNQNCQEISRTPGVPCNNLVLTDEFDVIQNDEDYICIIVAPQDEATQELENIPRLQTHTLSVINKLQNNIASYSNDVKISEVEKSLDISKTKCKWSKRTKARLLRLYKNYVMQNRHQRTNETNLWIWIGSRMHRSPYHCRAAFIQMKTKYSQYLKQVKRGKLVKWPHFVNFKAIKRLKPLFTAEKLNWREMMTDVKPETKYIRDSYMKEGVVERMLSYYLDNIEQFVNPKYYKMYVWAELGRTVGENSSKCYQKFKYLTNFYNELKINDSEYQRDWPYFNTFELITAKENKIVNLLKNDQRLVESKETCKVLGFDLWDDDETEKLLEWFLSKADKFRNPKYIKKYLWREAELALGLSAGRCSKKIRDMRGIYRLHLKALNNGTGTTLDWKYFSICSKIYGTDLKDPFLARTKKPRGHTPALDDSDQESTNKEKIPNPLKKTRRKGM